MDCGLPGGYEPNRIAFAATALATHHLAEKRRGGWACNVSSH